MFEDVTRLIPAAAEWLELEAKPITSVHSMAGLLNRKRTLCGPNGIVVDSFHLVGDALICTNPLYGRGCSTGFWQAHLLAQSIQSNNNNSIAQGEQFAQNIEENILPWYSASVESDKGNRASSENDEDELSVMKKSILKEGLIPATRTSAKVWRAFMKMMNLLAEPKILSEPDVSLEIMRVWEQRESRKPDPPLGPSRQEMIEHLQLAENV